MLEYLRLRAGDAGFKDGDATHVDQPVVAAPEDQRRRPHLAEPVVERMVAQLRRDHPEDAVELRSEEHTSELQSLMRISYAVFCLKKKQYNNDYLQPFVNTTKTPSWSLERFILHIRA